MKIGLDWIGLTGVDVRPCGLQLSDVIMAGRVCRCAKAEVMFLAYSADAAAEACG